MPQSRIRRVSKRRSMSKISALALAGFAVQPLAAQYAPPPETYSVTQVNSMMGPSMITRVWRDGNKARIDSNIPASAPGAAATHVRTIYDLAAHTSTSWDPTAQSPQCGSGKWGGDWGDPFQASIEMTKDLAAKQAKPAGTEMVNNVSAKVFDDDLGKDGKVKVWIEPRYGLIMRAQMGAAPPLPTILETQVFSLSKPPANTFEIPAACKAAAEAPSPDDLKIAEETGEPASNFASATRAGAVAGQSCTVLLRLVQYKTMTTFTGGYQIGLDREVDDKNPADYAFGPDAQGHMVVKGGHLAEVTNQLRNGVLRIENAPPEFHIEIRVPNGGGSATLYRQCAGPTTTLLFVVDSLERMGLHSDWLWVKSGKQAGR